MSELEWDPENEQECTLAQEAFRRLTRHLRAFTPEGKHVRAFRSAEGHLVFKKRPTALERLMEDEDGDGCDGTGGGHEASVGHG